MDPRVRWELRAVLLLTCSLYAEWGAPRFWVTRLLGDQEPYKYGVAADVSVFGLPGVRRAELGVIYRIPKWIERRLNLLFPFGEGSLQTATYDGMKIKLQIPTRGFSPASAALSEWMQWGATGRRLQPQKAKV